MNPEREDLLAEANTLGLEFHSNIPTKKLKALVAEAKGEPPAVEETAPPNPPVKAIPDPEPEEENLTPREIARNASQAKYALKRKKIADAKARAFRTRIVTITNKDNRENDVMTTAYLSFENQHFGLSKLVPLDVPVELEQALINIAASTTMTLHKDEIVDGRRTGNKVATRVKKFAISYHGDPKQ